MGERSAGEIESSGCDRARAHQGETLAEGQLRTTQEDVREFFQALIVARVVVEVGTHSAWVQEVITECGHEVLVANPRLMEGSKRRKRKSDRIDAHKLARLGERAIRSRCTQFGTAVGKCARIWLKFRFCASADA